MHSIIIIIPFHSTFHSLKLITTLLDKVYNHVITTICKDTEQPNLQYMGHKRKLTFSLTNKSFNNDYLIVDSNSRNTSTMNTKNVLCSEWFIVIMHNS